MRPEGRGWAHLLPGGVLFAACFAVLLATAGCGQEEATGCRAEPIVLTRTALTALPDVQLHRAGDGFLLVGSEREGRLVRVARLSAAGRLGQEIDLVLAPPLLGPYFAPVARNTPGDQLLVVHGVAHPADAGKIALRVRAIDVPPADPLAAIETRPLLDGEGREALIERTERASFQAAMGAGAGGTRAAFAWGLGRQDVAPTVVLLAADGVGQPVPGAVAPPDTPWDCLAVTAGRADFGVSLIGRPADPGRRPVWHFHDLREDSSTASTLDVQIATREMGCPVVAPTSKGYTLAWQNRDGTYFSSIDTTREETLLVSDIVKAAVRFGGPDRQPPLGCIAPMDRMFAIVYDAPGGPLADRFDIFGNPRGASLRLPARRRGDRLSALPGIDAVFTTYLDDPPETALDARYFVRIVCPPL